MLFETRSSKVHVKKPTPGSSSHRKWVVQVLGDCAASLDTDIVYMTRTQFREYVAGNDIPLTDKDLVSLGGFTRIKNYAYDALAQDPQASAAVLGQIREVQHGNTHRRALERQLGDVDYIARRMEEALVAAVAKNPPKISKLTKPKINWKKPTAREIVVHISDTHFGQCVNPEEVAGGRYDWEIAARRMGYLCHQVAGYRKEFRKDTTLRLVLNGDLLEGKIHDDDRGVDLMSAQIDGTRQILTSMIDFFRHHFGRIEVIGQTGNHERWPFRGPGRPTAQKFDSATTTVLRGVEQIFRSAADVRFHIPLTPFSVWEACGWRFMATHGDDVFAIGNPGKGIQFQALFHKLYAMEVGGDFGGRVNMVMMGHWHNPLLTRIPGIKPQPYLTVNGCASGRTAYTQTIGAPSASPVQTFWEVTTESPVADFQMCDLDSADTESIYEGIVPVPTPIGYTLPKNGAATDFYALAEAVRKGARK